MLEVKEGKLLRDIHVILLEMKESYLRREVPYRESYQL